MATALEGTPVHMCRVLHIYSFALIHRIATSPKGMLCNQTQRLKKMRFLLAGVLPCYPLMSLLHTGLAMGQFT
eukprot:13448309-Ditylum_brightwellii.AAC.1